MQREPERTAYSFLRPARARSAPVLAALALSASVTITTGCAAWGFGNGPSTVRSVACGQAPGWNGAPSLTVEVGAAARLTPGRATPNAMAWTSSAREVAVVDEGGLLLGLRPGTTWIQGSWQGRPATQCLVAVVGSRVPFANPAALRQYADNRRFELNGRVCVGSELNGQRAGTPEERELVEDNRIINPTPLNSRARLEWEVDEGTSVYDGAGVVMGTVAPTTRTADGKRVPSSKFNFGMSKVLGGRLCVYAFAVAIRPSPQVRMLAGRQLGRDGTVRTSAWIPLDSVVDRATLLERAGLGKVKLPRLPLEPTGYRITGGDPNRYMTEYGELRIVKNPDSEPVPSHYLRRPSGTVNIIYSVPGFGLGGQGLDSFLVTDGVVFRRARGARAFVQPTYYPGRHPWRGRVSDRTMTFVYGAAEAPGLEPVYGWVAAEALEGG